ncbi:glycerate kinase [Halovenus rubra]|uniref:Glycerate kinase n=2 Tax=Halovenus rubra TaxID=869890 RepID=A0ABD5X042_9EURY
MIRNEPDLARTPTHEHALRAIAAGIDAAHPETVIAETVSLDGDTLSIADDGYDLNKYDRLVVLGGGKPAGAVARALEAVLGNRIDDGAVVTKTPEPTDEIAVYKGNHPLPTKENVHGATAVLDLAATAGPDDLVLVVASGGASALLSAPVDGVSVEAYRDLTEELLESGATIDELNAVRKHLSRLKGGRLACELAPATTVGVVFSDVVGNPLDVIASGPTAPDSSTYDDALTVLKRYDIDAPPEVTDVLDAGIAGDRPETPGPNTAVFEHVSNHVLADNRTALDGTARVCEQAGYETVVLSTRIEGEAQETGQRHAAVALECLNSGDPAEPPVALLSGGETTVTVTGNGRGGPNQEFALAAALELRGEEVCSVDSNIVLASVDTDGLDGSTDAAGALVDYGTVTTNSADDARNARDDNDAYGYLHARGSLIETGPTGTNVNDLRLVLVGTPR